MEKKIRKIVSWFGIGFVFYATGVGYWATTQFLLMTATETPNKIPWWLGIIFWGILIICLSALGLLTSALFQGIDKDSNEGFFQRLTNEIFKT